MNILLETEQEFLMWKISICIGARNVIF